MQGGFPGLEEMNAGGKGNRQITSIMKIDAPRKQRQINSERNRLGNKRI